MKIRVEISCLATASISGVGHYTKLLTEALDNTKDVNLTGSYLNFMNRQPTPEISLRNAREVIRLVPLRVYAKLQSHNIAPPLDALLSRVDLTIFPNFATWPCSQSSLRGTVIHDLTFLYFPELVEDKNLAHLLRVVPRSIKEADIIITVSHAVKTDLVKEFSLNPDQCVVTPIPPESSYYKQSDNEIHKKYSIPTDKYLLFIGTLEPRKNITTLVDAYCKLPPDIKSIYSLVIGGGKGWKTEESQNTIDKAVVAGEKIVQVGYIDQVDAPAFFQKASVFIMPSIYEGFGMQILEALAANTPVVASDIPVFREVGGDAILYASPMNSTEFCQQIVTLLSNDELVAELHNKGVSHLKKFSWQKNSETIVSFAQTILDRRPH